MGFEFVTIRFDAPYSFHHLTLMACLHHFVDFYHPIMPIIYLVNFCQCTLFTKMSKFIVHLFNYLLLFIRFRDNQPFENQSLPMPLIVKRFFTLSNSCVLHTSYYFPPFKIMRQIGILANV
jgi:hypothetical protein